MSNAPNFAEFPNASTSVQNEEPRTKVETKLSGTAPAKALYRLRRRRERLFPDRLFSEPAWDMLLDLWAAERASHRVSITSVCIAAMAPNTTAVRCLRQLEELGMVYREADPKDGRRINIRLSKQSIDTMERLIEDLCGCFGSTLRDPSTGTISNEAATSNLPANLAIDSIAGRLDDEHPEWCGHNTNHEGKGEQMQELTFNELNAVAAAGGVVDALGGLAAGGGGLAAMGAEGATLVVMSGGTLAVLAGAAAIVYGGYEISKGNW